MEVKNNLKVRQRFVKDLHRPRYHFLPPSNWMNDPNGVIQWKGNYHLFYQHNPYSPLWANMHWGHAVSPDLIHWTDLPLALAPTPGGPDEAGCFSGCAVYDSIPTLVYTGTVGAKWDIQTQCLATSHDDLLTWQKHTKNPVLRDVPAEAHQTADFRDPFVWKEGDLWYMVLGSRIKDVGGVIFLYRSKNLVDWEYLNPLLTGDIKRNGVIWECPNLFRLGDEWVLIISAHLGKVTGSVFYFVGSYENFRFTPRYEGMLDHGYLYAPLSMQDSQNRRVLFGWIREGRPSAEQEKAGWSGVQSIPRVLNLDSHGRLTMTPVPELETLRGKHLHVADRALTNAYDAALDVEGRALDIVAEFQVEPGGQCGLSLLCSPDGLERLDILYETEKHRLVVKTVAPDQTGAHPAESREAPHELGSKEPLRLRILVDGSVVEIIANERTSLTARVYPSRADSNKVHLLGTRAHLRTLDIWEMSSIW